MSTVSTLASKPPFPVLFTAYTILGPQALLVTTVTLAVHTTQTKSMYCLPYYFNCVGGNPHHHCPWIHLTPLCVLQGHLRTMRGAATIFGSSICHSYYSITTILSLWKYRLYST